MTATHRVEFGINEPHGEFPAPAYLSADAVADLAERAGGHAVYRHHSVTPWRTLPEDRTAPPPDVLVMIEVAERLIAAAHNMLVNDGDVEYVKGLLAAAHNATTATTCTHVKDQALSDSIAREASAQVRRVHADVAADVLSARGL